METTTTSDEHLSVRSSSFGSQQGNRDIPCVEPPNSTGISIPPKPSPSALIDQAIGGALLTAAI